jgi:hypothetical protein
MHKFRGLPLATSDVVECWIGVDQQIDRRVVRLAGRLSVEQVPALFAACAGDLPIEIDVREMMSVDVAGIEALQRLRAQGATVVGAAGYIQMKLDTRRGTQGRLSRSKGHLPRE